MANDNETPDDEDGSTDTSDTSEDSESTDTSESEGKEEGSSQQVKVPEAFQKEATALVQSCPTIACLDFLSAEVNEMRSKLMSSQKKAGLNKDSFSDDGMPSE